MAQLTPLRGLYSVLAKGSPADVIDYQEKHPDPFKVYGIPTVPGSGTAMPYPIVRGMMYPTGSRGYRETMPGDEDTIGAATVTVDDVDARQFELPPTQNYGSISIEGPVIVINRSSARKWLDVIDFKTQRMARSRQNERCRKFWGSQSGELAQVQNTPALGATTIRLRRDDQTGWFYASQPGARYCRKGRKFVLAVQGVKLNNFAYRVTGVPRTRPTLGYDEIDITPGLEQITYPGTTLHEGGRNGDSINKEPWGQRDIIDDGRVQATYGGVPRADFPELAVQAAAIFRTTTGEGAAGHFMIPSDALWRLLCNVLVSMTSEKSWTVSARGEVFDRMLYGTRLQNFPTEDTSGNVMTQLNQGGGQGSGKFYLGYKVLEVMDPDAGQITLVRDPDCPYSTIYVWRPESYEHVEWQPWSALPGFDERLRGGVRDTAKIDVLYAEYMEMDNIVCKEPFAAGLGERVRCTVPNVPLL